MKLRQLNFIKILNTLFLDSKNTPSDPSAKSNHPSLLIIRLDAIGDYILFRNFLEVIRRSDKFINHKITLCGNEAWKEITEAYDKQFIDDTIWINRSKFRWDRKYRDEKLKAIAECRFDYAIETTTSRDIYFGDAIIKASNASIRVGKKGDTCNTIGLWKLLTDTYYTRLINVEKYTFEFDSNKKLFEEILNTDILVQTASFNLPLIEKENTVVLFPGASEKSKQWSPENFAAVADFLLAHTSYELVIAGAKNDSELAEMIVEKLVDGKERVKNLCGTTTLPGLIEMIHRSILLTSSDTSALHIGMAVKTKSIGLFDGRHFGRFAPYPGIPETEAAFLYPPPIGDYKTTYQNWIKENNEKNTGFNINDIESEYVIRKIQYLMS